MVCSALQADPNAPHPGQNVSNSTVAQEGNGHPAHAQAAAEPINASTNIAHDPPADDIEVISVSPWPGPTRSMCLNIYLHDSHDSMYHAHVCMAELCKYANFAAHSKHSTESELDDLNFTTSDMYRSPS